MGAGGVLPDGGALARSEIVHESARTRVTRLFLADRTVIRKEPLGPDADRRLRHELAMLERLRGVPGVAQLLDTSQFAGSILIEDVGGTSLTEAVKPVAVDRLIGWAVALAQAVAGVHLRGVMHRDIAPANIVISHDGVPCLVDFALAMSLAELRPEFTHHSEIVGTLAYLAPEQTGRTGRSVDQRADLYALGATLYALATGEPPFGSGDPLRLTHAHLARVPVPPADVNPAVPGPLSAMVMHLLEKEPDHRYQSADGVVYDLERLRDVQSHPAVAPVRVGEHDVPLRLLPPSRLVGRENEVDTLAQAFTESLEGRCRGVLIGGVPGVGKTVLANELLPEVTDRDGWFVAGKFDQYRRDLEFDAINQAFRALGRLLLAEPEDELDEVRARILAAVGANAGLLTAAVPEFAALLAVPPDSGDPLSAQLRAQRTAMQVLRAVASRKRPVVLFLDDLQWAGRTPLGVVDLALSEEPIAGLLVVGAYRDSDVDPAHPLAVALSRWRDQDGVRHLSLADLPASDTATMLAEMLHVEPRAAADLAELITSRTSGNPYETVELLKALHRNGLLSVTAEGWRWDVRAVRANLGQSDLAGLLAARIEAMPAAARRLVEAMGCLGGRTEISLLQTATAEPASRLEEALAPALDDGILVMEPGPRPAVRFRHDRIREAILRGLEPRQRHTQQLAMARRLAGTPELFAVAAEQYLPVLDTVDDPAERVAVVGLLRRAADQAALIGDHAMVNALLSAALRLIQPGERTTLVEVHAGRHAALYSMGRLDEADDEYRAIERLSTTALERASATAVQVRSLTHRKRLAEAIELGIESLREFGVAVPAADRIPAELDHQFEHLHRWLDYIESADDQARPDITDPTLLAATRLINPLLTTVYFVPDPATYAWLSLEVLRIWVEHGPGNTLIGPAGHAAFAAVVLRGDYADGYRAMRRIVAAGEARGHEPGTSQARLLFAVLAWWFEPIENMVEAGRRAREGLIAGGDLANAAYTYYQAVAGLLDCAPTLDSYVDEVEAGSLYVRRIGNEHTSQWLDTHKWLAGTLRGESSATPAEAFPGDRFADNPLALLSAHVNHAVAAAVFGDPIDLGRHTAAAMALLSAAPGLYATALTHLLRGLALAGQARVSVDDERGGMLAELDDVTRWLAERAADAPDNFLHLLRLVEAERAWTVGDFPAAVLAFDAARREVALRVRPWQRALIAERAARFHLAHGIEQAGHEHLAEARQGYLEWGATAKVAQLDWAYPTLRPQHRVAAGQGGNLPSRRSTVTTGTLDLLGVLSASQALSSETSIDRLHARVVQVLSAMTGATGVHMLLWSEARQDWFLPAPGGDTPHEGAIPKSVLRYTQRIPEPLVVHDAVRDDRFARDPYFTDVTCCSLVALPVLNRGSLRALLLLENRLIRGAFTAERLDAVKLIAGQLAVSIDNAQLYAELTASRARIVAAADQARRQIERDLHDGAQQRLVSIGLELRAAQAAVPRGAGELDSRLDDLAIEMGRALDELRELARGIHPALLAERGLRPALKALARRSSTPVELEVRVDERLPEPIETAAYYFVSEAMTNVAKHADASAVFVEVEAADGALRIRVRDDGRGGADLAAGSGLVGLKDRVEALGGLLSVQTGLGAGTTVMAELPLHRTPSPGGNAI
jgi:signal transduction histidine kinase